MKFISSGRGILFKTIITWLVAVFLLGILFKKYPLARLLEASHHFNILLFSAYVVLYFLFMLLSDCFSLSRLFARFGHPLPFWGVIRARLASHIPMIMNYGAGQGTLAYLFRRQHGVPFLKGSGLILFTTLIDFYITLTFAFVGSFFFQPKIAGHPLAPLAAILWTTATITLFLSYALQKLSLFKGTLKWPKIAEFFHLLHEGRLPDFVKLILMRAPMHLAINTSLYWTALIFHAHLPFPQCLAFSPFIILAAVIPITPGGLGITQAATVEIFKDLIHISADLSGSELLFFMSLMTVFSNYFLKSLTGLFFFKGLWARRTAYLGEVAT